MPRWRKALVLPLIGSLALPFDLVPDFIPVAGELDEAILVALVLRIVVRGAGPAVLGEHWPGPDSSRSLVERWRTAGPVPELRLRPGPAALRPGTVGPPR